MTSSNASGVIIEPIHDANDFVQFFHVASEAFGRQAKDAIWIVTHPGWDTSTGAQEGAGRLRSRFESIRTNRDGKPNTVFLKATLPDPEGDPSKGQIVGLAIWQQVSIVDGYGDPPADDPVANIEIKDPTEKRFASQMLMSLYKRRIEVVKEKANSSPPAILALDFCAVDPAFQKRGIAGKLVQWGLDEAQRRNPEATTEASSMGRGVYEKLGFRREADRDIEYEVDEEFRTRVLPPNVFLRTGI
jgi:ribosomal protein S18 acetylase RimI-like enzyme